MLKIKPGKYKAVIFDADGTMVDSNPWHGKAFRMIFEKYNLPEPSEQFRKNMVGRKNSEIFPLAFPGKSKKDLDRLINEKETTFRKICKNNLKEVKGLKNFIGRLKERGLVLAMATTASKENREFFLKVVGLPKNIFSIVVGDEDVREGKPHPEIYLKAAKKLGVRPKDCLAFEDSASGIKSAKSAGMTVVAVDTNKRPEALKEAEYIVNDFDEIELV